VCIELSINMHYTPTTDSRGVLESISYASARKTSYSSVLLRVVAESCSYRNCNRPITVIILAVVGITYDTLTVSIARPTNAAIGRSPEQRRAATSNKPTNSIKLPNDVINHNLQRRRRKHVLLLALVQSTGFKGCIIRWDVASQRSAPMSLTSGIRRRRRRRCTVQQFPQQRLSAN